MGRLTLSYTTDSQQQGQALVGPGDLSSDNDFEKILTFIKLHPHASCLFDARAWSQSKTDRSENGLEFVIAVQGNTPQDKRKLLLRLVKFSQEHRDSYPIGANISFVTHPNRSKKALTVKAVEDDISRLPTPNTAPSPMPPSYLN